MNTNIMMGPIFLRACRDKTVGAARVTVLHRQFSSAGSTIPTTNKDVIFTPEGRVLVVGGGVGGLTLALALRQKGIGCDVVDMPRDITANDNGLFLNINAMRVLKELGLYDAVAREGQEIHNRVIMSADSHSYGQVEYPDLVSDVKPFSIHRQTLRSILHKECSKKNSGDNKAQINMGSRVSLSTIEYLSGRPGVRCRFSSGRSAETFQAVIGADGASSKVRASKFGAEKDYDAMVTRPNPWVLMSNTIERPFMCDDDKIIEMWGVGKRLTMIPINNNKLYVWGVYSSNIPVSMLKEGERPVEEFIKEFRGFAGVAPNVMYALEEQGGMTRMELPFEIQLKRWNKGPIALIGDAAHVMAPNIHQGTT